MIQDPIVVRVVRDRFIVSATKSTDPVQLIRQLSDTEIEIHLKNGTTYKEQVSADDLHIMILELMGFREETMVINFNAWPDAQDRLLKFKFSPTDLKKMGDQLLDRIFERTPYLKSKLISLKVSAKEEKKDYYDVIYGMYDVRAELKFWCRVDMPKEIVQYFDDHREDRYHLIGVICDRTDVRRGRVSRNEIELDFLRQDF